jgi:activator of HSP90 ATPase
MKGKIMQPKTFVRSAVLLALLCSRALCAEAADAPKAEGLTHDAAAIHQEVTFTAPCERVYHALTDARLFETLTRLSDAASLLSAPNAIATTISNRAGGTFTLFGGYITGRNLELLSNQRLVQAWRAGSWAAGEYSVVRFELQPRADTCRLLFDQRGFPADQGTSLAYGWRVHYWDPLAKLLSQP